jgi:hypothetical protein|tara:strand:+ start:1471 stop:1644 length:174 start_codon:yes stop_codon:yes gene_type:complete
MNTQELFEQISGLYETAKLNHSETTKAAKGRARKALSEMKKMIAVYNKTSVVEAKTK